MSHMDFSSWPREQEAAFVVYEQRNAESAKKAWTFGIALGAIVLVAMIGIYKGVTPDTRDFTKDMNMSNLTKKKAAAAPAPTPTPAPAAETAPAPAAPAAEAPAAPATENK